MTGRQRHFASDDADGDSPPTVTVDARATKETELALLVTVRGAETWIPKSVIDDLSEVFDAREHATGRLVVRYWFARKHGWVIE